MAPTFAYSWTELGDSSRLALLWVTGQGPSPLWAHRSLRDPGELMAGARTLPPLLISDLWSSALATLVQDTSYDVASLLSCPHQGGHSHTCKGEDEAQVKRSLA